MNKQDYYELLSVSRTASKAEIKAAYRKAALQHHPDRNPGDAQAEANFKAASEAYEVLTDDRKRQIYDQYGHAGLQGQGYQGPQDMHDIFQSFGSIFEDFFGFSGGKKGGGRPSRGADLRYDLEISFKEAVFGVEKEITFQRHTPCPPCEGSGAQAGSKRATCPTCGGAGQVRRSQGFFSIASPCGQCHGEGSYVVSPCKTCKGKGVQVENKKLTVKIPAGVDHGVKLRVSEEGEAALQGGRRGDLYVVLYVQESHRFVREEADVIVQEAISFPEAALGGDRVIETLDGEATISIPAGSPHGHRITLHGAGIPHLRGKGRGNLYVELQIQVPKKLTKEQRQLLEQFAAISGESGKKGGGFFQKIFE